MSANRMLDVACGIVIASSLLAVSVIWSLSYWEIHYSYPPKDGVTTDLPRFAGIYFRYYHLTWFVPVVSNVWGLWLMLRKTTTMDEVLVFSLCHAVTRWFEFALLLGRVVGIVRAVYVAGEFSGSTGHGGWSCARRR